MTAGRPLPTIRAPIVCARQVAAGTWEERAGRLETEVDAADFGEDFRGEAL